MSPPLRVLIAVPTFRRPAGLARLLRALQAQAVPPGVAAEIAVLDNSPEGAALAVAVAGPLALRHAHVPVQGLARVRNAALDAGLAAEADLLGFVDDDEWPEPDWLARHLALLAATGAQASQGPVLPVFEGRAPGWLRRRAAARGPADGAALAEGYSSNIVFALAPVRAHGLRFDPRFDLTGGEDTAFFAAYIATGARIVHCRGAAVRESVPARRATLRWHWRRWRRTGQTSAGLRLGGGLTRAQAMRSGLGRVAAGAGLALAGAAVGRWDAGVRIAARGLGYVDAARGRRTREYEAPER